MKQQPSTTDASGRITHKSTFGDFVFRWRWAILVFWLTVTAAIMLLVGPTDPQSNDVTSFLPADSRYSQAAEVTRQSFPRTSGFSQAVVIFDRSGPLTQADLATAEAVASRIPTPSAFATGAQLEGVRIMTPALLPLKPNPLISADRKATIVRVSIPSDFITLRSAAIVNHIRGILAQTQLPAGLNVAVTGSSGFGRDYALAAEMSHRQTLYVTLAAVAIILLLVYRSPLAAMVPLLCISMAALISVKVLSLGHYVGLHVGTAEGIFVIVLLYGAGVDYSLLLISRYREFLDQDLPKAQSTSRGLRATLPAIVAAAATNILGLLMLCFARYRIFHTTGPAVAIALTVALAVSVTLVPAILGIMGRNTFWPTAHVGQMRVHRFWHRLGALVTTHPLAVLLITLAVMAVPTIRGIHPIWVYDTLAQIRPSPKGEIGNAAAGMAMAREHWPVGEMAPVEILVRSSVPLGQDQWRDLCARLTSALDNLKSSQSASVNVIGNVRSLTQPLGKSLPRPPATNGRPLTFAGVDIPLPSFNVLDTLTKSLYLADDSRSIRLEAVLDMPPLQLQSMAIVDQIRQAVQQLASAELARLAPQAQSQVYITGATAEMMETRAITQKDFKLIAVLVLAVIFAMAVVLLRDAFLSLFMLLSTVLSYFATLGVCVWVFAWLGYSGVDWKIEIFLFVVMVAVGQDYNLFLAARLAQESRSLPPRKAARNALIFTGPVISSAGLIMAATLGSLMAGELPLLVQLGFALSLGMLIDTFIVRPLILPSFCALTGRTGSPRSMLH